ncbi:hypothetical protein WA026_009408 [Henosepilachna vigintioctopunctata]|uniref:GDP/GTP exchange factor Sec2 N-terminal domain-containing protein n=1 Tax=Henosepilachna vigintioctopunctata TaxID=420089 RepID=A0AAW1U8G9_9CUCU
MSDAKPTGKEDLSRKDSINRGLLMVPTNVKATNIFPSSHRRTGSTGTTGDESYTTDEEDDIDENDFNISKHSNFYVDDFGSMSGISTITDKIDRGSLAHRNSSDLSVYKCSDESVTLNGTGCIGENLNERNCTIDWSAASAVDNVDEFTFEELKTCLIQAHRQLKSRKEEVQKLNRIKQVVEAELEDLTASLFQEAHNMVRDANEKQAAAERALKESEMKVEVLMAEVAALKTLVITSTPSCPNPHLHPQIDKHKEEGVVIYNKKQQRSPHHYRLTYGIGEGPTSTVETAACPENANNSTINLEIDPILHSEFIVWKEKPVFDLTSEFISRAYTEDINLCLSFVNTELSEKVTEAVEKGIILIESFGDKSRASSGKCALMCVPKICSYRMNLGDESDNWYNISQICRNRITAVCDFLNYLKYIERGLVKSSVEDMYAEVIRLRKNMVLGRLGFPTTSR